MAVDFEDDAERIFDIAHAIAFLAGVIFADRHPLLAASRHDLFDQAFNVGVLDAEVERAVALVVEIVLRRVVFRKLENLDADTVGSGQMGDLQRFPVRAEHVGAHHADWTVVLYHLGWLHDGV